MNQCERYVFDKLEDIFIAHLKVEPIVSDLQRKGTLSNKEADNILTSVGYVKQTRALLNTLKTKKGIFDEFESILKAQNRYLYSRTQKEKKNFEKLKRELVEDHDLATCSSRLERLENKVDQVLGALHDSRDFGSHILDMPPLLTTSADQSPERLANTVGEYSNGDVIPLASLKSLSMILAPYHDRIIEQLAPQWFVNQSYRIRMLTYDESMVIALSDWLDHKGKKATWESLKDIVRKHIIYSGPVVNRIDIRRIIDEETDKKLRMVSQNLQLEESSVLAKYLGLSSVQVLHLQAENMKFGPSNLTYNTILVWLTLLDNFDDMPDKLAEALALTERLDLADSIQTWLNSKKGLPDPRDAPYKRGGNLHTLAEEGNDDVSEDKSIEGELQNDDDKYGDDFEDNEEDDGNNDNGDDDVDDDEDDVDVAKETVSSDGDDDVNDDGDDADVAKETVPSNGDDNNPHNDRD